MRAPDVYADVPLDQVYGGGRTPPTTRHYDICIVGSGPGGSTVAALAARRGLKTLILEEGPFARAQDFSAQEVDAAGLYQDRMSRRTADGGITILQGRAVGGSSTLNWTSSFRLPSRTREHWEKEFQLGDLKAGFLDAEQDEVEKLLHVTLWDTPNANNAKIAEGCQRLGWHWGPIPRSVRGCWNLGLCGLGCPTNAKQSALVTTVKDALLAGATLVADAKADVLVAEGQRVVGVRALVAGVPVTFRAGLVVVACGAIGSPALLLRSGFGVKNPRIGQRTFLHPVVTSFAKFSDAIEPWAGAPQSVFSDEFLWPASAAVPGFKIETMPLLPMFAAGLAVFHGDVYKKTLGDLGHVQGSMALQRDGFEPQSPGGRVTLDRQGRPVLEYVPSRFQFEGFRRALLALAEMQFAAGASEVIPVHLAGLACRTMSEAKQTIGSLAMKPYALRIGSAHVMGGCGMSPDPSLGVADASGRVHGFSGLYVADGSLFPTSLGVNPQVTIYALALRLARGLLDSPAARPF